MGSRQNRRDFLKTIAVSSLAYGLGCNITSKNQKPPNFVIVFLDDSGWSDFNPFGNPSYQTPNVQLLAQQGCRFNNFYVPQAVCSASRASLLTGCYPGRTKVFGAHGPHARGLDPEFATIGEVLKKRGYKTGTFGKWHIGDQPETRPPARGFDESCGLMYSNDMWKYHPENPDYWGQWPLQYWENGKLTIEDVTDREQAMLTTWYTEHAVDFINRNKNEPFFLYVPHSMPHVPLFCSEIFKGRSGLGLYADVMMEIDWSVGQIVETLKSNGLDDNTVVIFTSDNGPWISYGNHAGKTPFREAKGTTFDGGTRSACIIKYPNGIKQGSISEKTLCSIDILPVICHLAGAELPVNEIDGKNVWNIITNKADTQNPHEYYAFSNGNRFEGIITGDGKWKLHLPHNYRTLVEAGMDGEAGKYRQEQIEMSLFDMENDPIESVNVIDRYPQETSRLMQLAEQHKNRFYNN
ncbi:sulfatase [candidate division KSB1 bacterium]